MSEYNLVLILVLAEGCVENDTSLESLLKEKVEKTEVSLRVLRVCFDEKNMPWPRPLTNSIYYFAPKTTKPLFLRVGPEAIVRFYEDLEISEKMIGGMTYDQAMFDMYYEDDQELIQKTEEMFDDESENKSKYPSKVTMLRNFAKDMWKTAKSAGHGLPILVSKDLAIERYSICEQCPNLTEEGRCTECGCFMRRKVNLAATSCPIDKWDSTN